MDAKQLQKRAKRRHAELTRVWADARFKQVIGRYVSAGLLTTTTGIQPNSEAIAVKDALWAGLTEPRILELLPALIVKRPALFSDVTDLPDDLSAAVSALRRNERPKDFRGIPGAASRRSARQGSQSAQVLQAAAAGSRAARPPQPRARVVADRRAASRLAASRRQPAAGCSCRRAGVAERWSPAPGAEAGLSVGAARPLRALGVHVSEADPQPPAAATQCFVLKMA
jgi:hypothetical protein